MNKLSLILLSSPALAAVLLLLVGEKPARAADLNSKTNAQNVDRAAKANIACSQQNCTGNNHLANYLKLMATNSGSEDEFSNVKRTPEGHLILEFTEEESNAAIEMFGCDCVNSINALRQIRGIAIGVEGNTIIPGPKIKPCNQSAPEIEG